MAEFLTLIAALIMSDLIMEGTTEPARVSSSGIIRRRRQLRASYSIAMSQWWRAERRPMLSIHS